MHVVSLLLSQYSATTDGVNVPSTIIDERALRALFMRAIICASLHTTIIPFLTFG